MTTADITSAANPRIKRLVRLRDRAHRDTEGVFVVEGDRLVNHAKVAGLNLIELYAIAGHPSANEAATVVVDPEVLNRASYRDRSDGVIAVFEQFDTDLDHLTPGSNPLLVVVENTEKPGNLGAMARTASAVGADALIAVGGLVDPFNPNAIRASTGAIFSLPIATSTPGELLPWLEARGVDLMATVPGRGLDYWDADLTGPIALAVGSEDAGLTNDMIDAASHTLSVPMSGHVDSLNVSVTVALVSFEARRQRRLSS